MWKLITSWLTASDSLTGARWEAVTNVSPCLSLEEDPAKYLDM